ncbi:MAG: class I SAM-dependent methyltransferase [Candidatus Gracilibacteria bacterium]
MKKNHLKKFFKYLLPVPVKKSLKYLFYLAQDIFGTIFKTNLKGYPPKRYDFVGSLDFKKIGDEFTDYFIRLGGLKPTDTVLDIGSGIGRMAIPLKPVLTKGKYYGFDIDHRGIKWCQKNITKECSNFHFQTVDIFNKYYNKKGKIQAHEFKFPYQAEYFDFIFATSVFTHMLPEQISQYLKEIHRVLKPGGTCFVTWFSIDNEAQKNISQQRSHCNFKYEYIKNISFYSHKNVPEAEIGYRESWIIEQLKKTGMEKNLKIHHGRWSNRKKGLSYQDIFISKKGKKIFQSF